MNPIKYKHGRRTITNDIAYIAGFVDGEGCIRIKRSGKKHNYYITFQISNTDYDTLVFIQMLFGGQIGFQEKGVNKKIYQYRLVSAEAVDAIKLLFPFLRAKRSQAHLAMMFHDNKHRLSPELRDKYYYEMMALKKRTIHSNPELLGE